MLQFKVKIDKYMVANKLGTVQLFRELDKNQDCSLEKSEIIEGLNKMSISITIEQADAMACILDSSRDGNIDMEELSHGIRIFRKVKRTRSGGSGLDEFKKLFNNRSDPIFPNHLIARGGFFVKRHI
mmetsp:Transcript_56200/g.67718  ORF Transcript_56200/g.67718 Transcript_56200/m.67718 type:complete len:127 (-) Transcript_56200:68-448(-)